MCPWLPSAQEVDTTAPLFLRAELPYKPQCPGTSRPAAKRRANQLLNMGEPGPPSCSPGAVYCPRPCRPAHVQRHQDPWARRWTLS